MAYICVKRVYLIFMINGGRSDLECSLLKLEIFKINSESSNPGLYRVKLSHLGGSELTNMAEKLAAVCL